MWLKYMWFASFVRNANQQTWTPRAQTPPLRAGNRGRCWSDDRNNLLSFRGGASSPVVLPTIKEAQAGTNRWKHEGCANQTGKEEGFRRMIKKNNKSRRNTLWSKYFIHVLFFSWIDWFGLAVVANQAFFFNHYVSSRSSEDFTASPNSITAE